MVVGPGSVRQSLHSLTQSPTHHQKYHSAKALGRPLILESMAFWSPGQMGTFLFSQPAGGLLPLFLLLLVLVQILSILLFCSQSLLKFFSLHLASTAFPIHLPHQLQNNLNILWLRPHKHAPSHQKEGETLQVSVKAVIITSLPTPPAPTCPLPDYPGSLRSCFPLGTHLPIRASMSPASLLQLKRTTPCLFPVTSPVRTRLLPLSPTSSPGQANSSL